MLYCQVFVDRSAIARYGPGSMVSVSVWGADAVISRPNEGQAFGAEESSKWSE
jgi:hypothetical protein